MEKENPEDLVIVFNSNLPDYGNVRLAFDKIIGALSLVLTLDSYKKSHDDYKALLSIILKWAADYEIKRALSLINHIELLDVYEKLEELRGKWLFEPDIGNESELSDQIVIWFWELMLLRKSQIESQRK